MSHRDAEFTAFVDEHRRDLLRAAFLTGGNWAHAEDVVQNALVKLYRAWPRVRQDRGALSYARQIVLRSGTDEWRRPWRREFASSDDLPESRSPDEITGLADRLDLAGALRQLPLRQRQVVVARFYLQLTVEETAAELQLSTGTVKSHTSRGIARLNALLTPATVPVPESR